MKYIVTEDYDGNEEIFLFSKDINHDAMAEFLGYIKNQTHGNWIRVHRTPVSAGFVRNALECYGSSETLGLNSRPQDTALLKSQY